MPQDTLERPAVDAEEAPENATSTPLAAPLLVRLEPERPIRAEIGREMADPVATTIAVAMAVACGLDRGVRLVAPLAMTPDGGTPVDPVEWDLRQRAVGAQLATLVARHAEPRCPLDYHVSERFLPHELDAANTVIGLYRGRGVPPWHSDEAMRRFLARGPGSILVVPDRRHLTTPVRFDRVMTALDGSMRAECALPSALAIARRHGAELLLAHATPEPPLTGSGPLEARALALADELRARNRRVADDYLVELRARHADAGVKLSTRLLETGDVRRRLVQAVLADDVDLLVIAAHGTSGHGDVASGAVASYVIEHAPVPVLMIGTGATPCGETLFETLHGAAVRPIGAANGDA